jgi:hypothetical protein
LGDVRAREFAALPAPARHGVELVLREDWSQRTLLKKNRSQRTLLVESYG